MSDEKLQIYINHDYSEFEDQYGATPREWEGKYGLLLGSTIIAIYDDVEIGFAELRRMQKEGRVSKDGGSPQLINFTDDISIVPFLEKGIYESDCIIDSGEMTNPFRGCRNLYNICKEIEICKEAKIVTTFNRPTGVLMGITQFMEYMEWKSKKVLNASNKQDAWEYFHIYDLLQKYETENKETLI